MSTKVSKAKKIKKTIKKAKKIFFAKDCRKKYKNSATRNNTIYKKWLKCKTCTNDNRKKCIKRYKKHRKELY